MGRKRKAKEPEKQDNLDGWNAKTGNGVLKGTKFADPPCPVGSNGFHQYVRVEETRNCRVWQCRLCERTVGVNKKTGKVRERNA